MAGSQRTCRASVPARKPRRAPVGGKTPPPPPTGILRTEVLVPTKALTKDLKGGWRWGIKTTEMCSLVVLEAGGAESGCRPGAFPAPAHRRPRGAAFPPRPASGRPCVRPSLAPGSTPLVSASGTTWPSSRPSYGDVSHAALGAPRVRCHSLSLGYICKDPLPKRGHTLRSWVDTTF